MTDNFPKAKLPASIQLGIDESAYRALYKYPHCARQGRECGDTPCQPLEEDGTYKVELDHIVPKAHGGSNSVDNLQWLCACKNREKYTSPDPRYSGHLYFDSEIDASKLRDHQRLLAYRRAVRDYAELFQDPTRVISRFMLLAWLVGAGKTIGMASILFGINHVRKKLNGGSAKRIKRVLWLVHQRSLVQALANELRTELTAHNIVGSAPSVETVENSAHWNYQADVIVACPQALWDSENRKLDEPTRTRILSEFDAIVVDEAHFGIERYIELCATAPTAFKFAITATPMNGDGEMFYEMENGAFRDWFALYSAFGYDAGFKQGFYKQVLPFSEGYGSVYSNEVGGTASIRSGSEVLSEDNTGVAFNVPRWAALVRRARRIAVAASAQSNYDHHIMVRAGSISHAKGIAQALDSDGDISLVYSGVKGPLLGSNSHPWMLAKQHDGKIPPKGKRIVITVDIGQFGINNRYCSIIVWLEPNKSVIEVVQRIGRAIRLGHGQSQSPIRLFWDSASPEMSETIAWSIEYILDMESRMEGFVAMTELVDEPTMVQPSSVERAVKRQDRIAIASLVGEHLERGLPENDALTAAMQDFEAKNPTASGRYLERVRQYGEALQTEQGREKALHIPAIFDPIHFVESEDAPVGYEVPRLIDAVESRLVYQSVPEDFREKVLKELRSEHPSDFCVEPIIDQLRDFDIKNRRLDDMTFYSVQDIVWPQKKRREQLPFVPLKTQIINTLKPAFSSFDDGAGAVHRALSNSLASLFGFERFRRENYQAYEKQLADVLMREHIQRLVISRTVMEVIAREPQVVPKLAKRFESEVRSAT